MTIRVVPNPSISFYFEGFEVNNERHVTVALTYGPPLFFRYVNPTLRENIDALVTLAASVIGGDQAIASRKKSLVRKFRREYAAFLADGTQGWLPCLYRHFELTPRTTLCVADNRIYISTRHPDGWTQHRMPRTQLEEICFRGIQDAVRADAPSLAIERMVRRVAISMPGDSEPTASPVGA